MSKTPIFKVFDAALDQKIADFGVLFHGPGLTIAPPFMTNETRPTALISSRGAPGTAMMSA